MGETSGPGLATHFASPDRDTGPRLEQAVQVVGQNPVINLLLETYGAVLAVLNKHRQVVTVNHALLDSLGLSDPQSILGLRPGEVLRCVHADEGPNGCGTSHTCANCGAVLAILASQQSDRACQGECHITIKRSSKPVTLSFIARAVPVMVESEGFTVLFLQDISESKRREAMDRTFYHDSLNTLSALHNLSHLQVLPDVKDPQAIAQGILRLTHQLMDEVEWRRDLELMLRDEYEARYEQIDLGAFLDLLARTFANHPLTASRKLQFHPPARPDSIHTSPVLLGRVLNNMIKNALEANSAGQTVHLWTRSCDDRIDWKVFNHQPIAPEARLRIFEGHYTTKPGPGRGLGTYSMKLLAEHYLDGQVGFVSSKRGTIFRLRLSRR